MPERELNKMTKLTEVLKSVALQSGVAETELQSILENASIGSIEIDDALSTKLMAPRLSMESAKSNPDLKKHFTAQALNGIDAELDRTMQEMGLDATIQSEIKGLDTTSKRVSKLTKKIQEIESSKAKGNGDVTKLNEQLTTLNNELKLAKDSIESEKATLRGEFEKERIDWTFNGILGNFNYALPQGTPKEAVIAFGRTIADRGLQEKGLKIVNENGSLVLKTSENTDYFEGNVKVGLNEFVQKTLGNAKVLSVSSPQTQTTPSNQVVQQHNANPSVNTSEFTNVIDKAINGEL